MVRNAIRSTAAVLAVAVLLSGCGLRRKKYNNPITKDTQQPDKVLFDKAINDIEHSRFEIARLLLQNLINTYDTSEYLAKARHFWGLFRSRPDMSQAAKSGTPPMEGYRPTIPASVPAAAANPGGVLGTNEVSITNPGSDTEIDKGKEVRANVPGAEAAPATATRHLPTRPLPRPLPRRLPQPLPRPLRRSPKTPPRRRTPTTPPNRRP
jgi:hypothetical protein